MSRTLEKALKHWSRELRDALGAGKTVFVLLNSYETDSLASGYSTPRKGSHNYSTYMVENYSVLPTKISLRNAKGRCLKVTDSRFNGLFESIKDIFQYKVIIGLTLDKDAFTTNDGNGVAGGVLTIEGLPGHLVLLPHFDLSNIVEVVDDETVWAEDAINISKRVVSQLVAIDKALRSEVEGTPKPEWIDSVALPAKVSNLTEGIEKIDTKILDLKRRKEKEIAKKNELEKYTALLYENGKALESIIEDSLRLLGYNVENYRKDDLEIDHVIVGPSELRMIGESEGKDSAAIGISKFRQLESNINEDFGRDGIDVPAKGILFGNGYRLTEPDKRENGFTKKCITNAKRLGTALVRTTDLYRVVLHILDNPEDNKFKEECREAIESTEGDIVEFPASS